MILGNVGGYSCKVILSQGVTGAAIGGGRVALGGWYISNAAASTRYVKFYNKSSVPTEADTPAMVLVIPASSAANVAPGGAGIVFPEGLWVRATTGIANNDTGAPTANDVTINLFFI